MKTYQCNRCHAIWNANEATLTCHSCQSANTSQVVSEQHALHLHMTRKNGTTFLEYKSDSGKKRFEWDSSPPSEEINEMISQEIKKWLSESLDSA